MEKLVIAACCNIDQLKRKDKMSRKFLNGAAIYSGYAAAQKGKVRVITCIGDEPENNKIIEEARQYRDKCKPDFDFVIIKGGKSFRQTFEEHGNSLDVIDKDFGNYNDWNPEINEFETDTLLLGTGNPIFQKAVLDSCKHANHILLDSKLIHLEVRADKVDEILKRVDTFFGNEDEIKQLLKNCKLTDNCRMDLFQKYPNLKVIIAKEGKKGGKVFFQNGRLLTYEPVISAKEICTDGAGDTFAGIYASLIANGKSVEDSIREAAMVAAESVEHFGMRKVKMLSNIETHKIKIYESRWDSRNGRNEQNSDRSD